MKVILTSLILVVFSMTNALPQQTYCINQTDEFTSSQDTIIGDLGTQNISTSVGKHNYYFSLNDQIAPVLVFDYDNRDYSQSIRIETSVQVQTELILTDNENYAALDLDATDGYDPGLDVPEPPPPSNNYVYTYFPHPEWSLPFGDNFMVDLRNGNDDLTNDVKIYLFNVDTDQEGETVDLSFSLGESYPANYGIVLHDLVDDSYQNLREADAYSFIAGGVARNFNLRLGDGTAPVVDITFPTTDTVLYYNADYRIDWSVSEVSPIRYYKLHYSIDDGQSWTLIDSISGENENYMWTIPESFSAYARLKIEAEDWPGNLDWAITEYTFNLAPNHLENDFSDYWHLISLPLQPQYASVDSIFGDDIIAPNFYFVYDYSQSGGGYGLVGEVESGPGYWLFINEGSMVDLDGEPEVDSTSIDMQEGWNIIGEAIAQDIPRDSLLFTDGNSIVLFNAAVDSNWILPSLYQYNGITGSYELTDSLRPWEGYWLYGLDAIEQMITYPPYPAGGVDLTSNERDDVSGDDLNWYIAIELSMGELYDELAGLGMNSNAADGYDVWYDVPTPPISPAGNYLRVIFEHPEWNAPPGDLFSRDIRATINNEQEVMTAAWDFMIMASAVGQLTMNFKELDKSLPEGYSIYLDFENRTINLLEQHSFRFDYTEPLSATIRVVQNSGTIPEGDNVESAGAVFDKLRIASIHPNPFNPETVITFELPAAGKVSLVIYDLQGREAARLVDGFQPAGIHRMTFDGSRLSSGVYFARLTAGNFQQTQKLLLVK